ncbi:hypothetical protein GCM10009539_69660 [Cryptosporangium japonicum]|uniref:Uncharacterized protein n=1 Tax=Cryptosporangium japonicum TaxID=80872 RepID=A0ABN0V2L7_9ACTN
MLKLARLWEVGALREVMLPRETVRSRGVVLVPLRHPYLPVGWVHPAPRVALMLRAHPGTSVPPARPRIPALQESPTPSVIPTLVETLVGPATGEMSARLLVRRTAASLT